MAVVREHFFQSLEWARPASLPQHNKHQRRRFDTNGKSYQTGKDCLSQHGRMGRGFYRRREFEDCKSLLSSEPIDTWELGRLMMLDGFDWVQNAGCIPRYGAIV